MTNSGPRFDRHGAPDPDIIADCVHCGFCLPTCPTYLLWDMEMDSPRGRIDLMRLITQGEAGLSPLVVNHFDNCLGCMACVTACPSGVQYDKLIEATRAQIERHVVRTPGDKLFRWLIFALFPYPNRLRTMIPVLALYQKLGLRKLARSVGLFGRLPKRLQAMESLLPPLPEGKQQPELVFVPAEGERRMRVGMISGCVQRVFFGDVNAATARVLAAEGCDVVIPPEQECCGALELHAGLEDRAKARARKLIDVFEQAHVDRIVINAAGCGSSLKQYGYLLRDDRRYAKRAEAFAASVRDITELLDELPPQARYQPLPARIAYHDACHLQHAQGIRRQPRAVLGRIPGLEIAEIAESEICCGSAGIYNLVKPEPAEALGNRKADNIIDTGAQALVSSNPGCLLQLRNALERRGNPLPAFHPVELLDASIRGQAPEPLRGIRPPAIASS